MDTPDFARVVEVTRPYLIKDSRHTLIIFTALGLALVIGAGFNAEYPVELFSVGLFLLVLGSGRYFFERTKRPYLFVACIKKKIAIPYKRIDGTYDYFIDIKPVANYAFTWNGRFEALSTEPEQRVGVSPDIFKTLQEESHVMILFSATRILVGILDEHYRFVAYL
jgi:hypothetical protein